MAKLRQTKSRIFNFFSMLGTGIFQYMIRALRRVEPRLRLPVEQSRRGHGFLRQEPDPLGGRLHQGDGLLGDRGGHAEGDPCGIHGSERKSASFSGKSYGPVAVQAPLPHAGRDPHGGAPVQGGGHQDRPHRDRFLPLDTAG